MNRGLTIAGAAILVALTVPVAAQAQKKELVVGAAVADAGKFDPHQTALGADKGMLNWVFNALVRIKPGQASPDFIEPDLAESWSSNADGTNGPSRSARACSAIGGYGEFTAEDAAYSLKRAADKATSAFAGDFAALDYVDGERQVHAQDAAEERRSPACSAWSPTITAA